MFELAGYECPSIKEDNRKLIFENEEKGIRYFWVKPSDVTIYVERGAADIGIAGKDIILEYEPDVYELLDMEGVVPPGYKIPHIGWNALHFPESREISPVFSGIREGDFVYFVHSYYGADCEDSVIATTEYGAELTAAVASGNVYGLQFHPEKSGDVGMRILKAFVEL